MNQHSIAPLVAGEERGEVEDVLLNFDLGYSVKGLLLLTLGIQ